MRSSAREPFFDAEAWRIATVSAPFVVQGVLALLMLTLWLLGEGRSKRIVRTRANAPGW